MRNKGLYWLAAFVALALTLGPRAVAQNPTPVKLAGAINDYNSVALGSYEMRGAWSLKVRGNSGTADFTAALNMEHSDLGIINGATTRNAHTHHIKVVGGTVLATGNGFRVTGPAIITINGQYPPPFGPNSTLQIDVTGSTGDNAVPYSNIQLTFINNADGTSSDAVKHFGGQVINGVVRSVKPAEADDH